jgi:membrane glycosyltransferase
MLLLLLPKFLALALALWSGRAREFGGVGKMIGSACLEIICSALIAPVFLSFHAKFVLFSLLGKKVEWHAQQRDCEEGAAWSEAREVFGLTTLIGIFVSVLTGWLTPGYFLWLLPIVLGWLLAIPLTALLGDQHVGAFARRAGLCLVPNELHPSAEVSALAQANRHEAPRAANLHLPAILDPRIQCALTGTDKADLHRRAWATPAAQLPMAWRRALGQLAS